LINGTFLHCRGVGLKTEHRLKSAGYLTWEDCLSGPADLPFHSKNREQFLSRLRESQLALQNEDIAFFAANYPIREHWRILGTFYQDATYFDIETSGLSSYSNFVTVITAYFQGELHTFLYEENLDDFLELVSRSRLLIAFNGNSFDIPFLENAFNIPEIGCPYLDLRWICYHEGYTGGLKQIENKMEIPRPTNMADISGADAVTLFYQWQKGDREARNRLVTYCQIDTLATFLVADRLLQEKTIKVTLADPIKLYELAGRID